MYNFEKLFNTDVLYIDISESTKNLVSVERVWNALFEHNLNRLSNLLIIGGGVLLDVCAFAASTYKRGISFCLVPTTLLAMVDALSQLLWLSTIRIPTFCTITSKLTLIEADGSVN